MKLTNAERLPCGCVIGDGPDDILAMQPCSPTCEYFRYFVGEADRQGKPTHYVRGVAEVDPVNDCEACRENDAYAAVYDGRCNPADLPFRPWEHDAECPWLEDAPDPCVDI